MLQHRLTQRLAEQGEVLFVLLFGSRAAGRPRADSDWDVAVFLHPRLTARQRWQERLRLSALLQELGAIDLVILNDAPPLLAHQALMGVRLWVRDPLAWQRFFVRTLATAEDERYWLGVHAKSRFKRLREGSFGRPTRIFTAAR